MSEPAPATSGYFGKYRGTVVNVQDPETRGRIIALVSDATGLTPGTWAEPCLPFAGLQSGAWTVPPVGSGVWIEFERGEVNRPIWTGGYWSSASEVPALALATPATVPHVLLQTSGQATFLLSDAAGPTGGIMLKTSTGAMISINDTGITLSNGKGATIALTGNTVTINQGALTVT